MTTPDANHITIKTLIATPKYRCATIKVRHRPLAIFAMLAIVVFSAAPIPGERDATTSSRPTTSHSSGLRQYGCVAAG
jgi:hypothetical protein